MIVQRTPKSEFILTLTKKIKVKTSFWSCGKTTDLNTKRVQTTTLTNDILQLITDKSKMVVRSEEDAMAKIEDFLAVDPREFIKLLKDLSGSALDQ